LGGWSPLAGRLPALSILLTISLPELSFLVVIRTWSPALKLDNMDSMLGSNERVISLLDMPLLEEEAPPSLFFTVMVLAVASVDTTSAFHDLPAFVLSMCDWPPVSGIWLEPEDGSCASATPAARRKAHAIPSFLMRRTPFEGLFKTVGCAKGEASGGTSLCKQAESLRRAVPALDNVRF